MLRSLYDVSSWMALAAAGDPPSPPADPPVADPVADPPAADPEPPVAAAEGDLPAGDDPPEPAAPVAPAAPDWRERELGRKHRQLQDEKRARQAAEQRAADAEALLARQPVDPAAPPAPVALRAPVADDKAVETKARQIVAQNDFDRQCNATFDDGKKRFADKWDGALNQLNLLGGLGDGAEGAEVMTGVLAADDPAKVLFELGSKPDEYHRVMSLPPAKRLAEIVKLGMPAPKPAVKKPSDAPVPVDPIRGGARGDTTQLRDDLSDDEWYARRKAQKDRAWAAKNGRASA